MREHTGSVVYHYRSLAAMRENAPRPISEVRKAKFRMVEPGVRPFVRALDRAGFVPVWSCEGHLRCQLPPEWFASPVLKRLERAGIRWWQYPKVICSGDLIVGRLDDSALDRHYFLATAIKITRPGVSLTRALPDQRVDAKFLVWRLFIDLSELPQRTLVRFVEHGGLKGRTVCYAHYVRGSRRCGCASRRSHRGELGGHDTIRGRIGRGKRGADVSR